MVSQTQFASIETGIWQLCRSFGLGTSNSLKLHSLIFLKCARVFFLHVCSTSPRVQEIFLENYFTSTGSSYLNPPKTVAVASSSEDSTPNQTRKSFFPLFPKHSQLVLVKRIPLRNVSPRMLICSSKYFFLDLYFSLQTP